LDGYQHGSSCLFSAGKLQALAAATRDQRREYKAKFVDMDVEFQRMKDRMEMLSTILDDMHVRKQEQKLTSQ
jgi:hypothetical protein